MFSYLHYRIFLQVQSGRVPDAEADGRVRGLAPPVRIRLQVDGADGRAGKVHGTQQVGAVQAQLLQILTK